MLNKWKFRIWPWKLIAELESQVSRLNAEVAREKAHHTNTKLENVALKGEIKIHQDRSAEREKHMRKMVNIIAIKGGILQ